MIIKEADDKKSSLKTLEALRSRPDCPANTAKRIKQEIRNIKAGMQEEKDAAYEMTVHWGESKDWMVLHDLRIEHDGMTAQIDHMLINRLMEIWVCESKHFSEGVAINDHGEFTAFFDGKPYKGMPSPIEQNKRHILILKRFFDSGVVKLPTRLGFPIKPDLKSLILVSKHARISRPKVKIDGLDCIIKNDQISSFLDRENDKNINPLLITEAISHDTLESLARDIARHHKPIATDWLAKFGLPNETVASKPAPSKSEAKPKAAQNASEEQKPKQKLLCHSCGISVSDKVVEFCRNNKAKFNGNIYCIGCQKKVGGVV